MNNLRIYEKVRTVPDVAIKAICAGRLKGMSDVNPMWRIKALTEQFGPCGFGWKYEIVKQWTEPYGQEVKAFCNINLYVQENDKWSDAIPGTGGSSMVSVERNGNYVNDEAYKMALTDAISVAAKALGVAADVYFQKGKEDTKYNYGEQSAKGEIVGVPDDDLELALQTVKDCSDLFVLKNIWNELSGYQRIKKFRDAVAIRGKELKNKQNGTE